MIYKHPKKPDKMGSYNRTEAQKKLPDESALGDSDRSYAKSRIGAPPIEYHTTGTKI